MTQNHQGLCSVGLLYQNIQMAERAKAKIAIGLNRKNRSLEGDRLDSVFTERGEHCGKFIEESDIRGSTMSDYGCESMKNVFGHFLARDPEQGLSSHPGEAMFDRLLRQADPIDVLRQHLAYC